MEPTPETSQNCFLPTGTDRKLVPSIGNEIYLYEEAEPLAYVCSETSMPTGSPVSRAGKPSVDIKSENISKTFQKTTRKSSTMVYGSSGWTEESMIQCPSSDGGSSFIMEKVSDIKSALSKKFKELTKTPNSSSLDIIDQTGSVDTNSEQNDGLSLSRNISKGIEEIFLHKAKFVVSSSESDRLRNTSEEHQDEVFSTGVSDIDDGATGNTVTANPCNVVSKLPQMLYGTPSPVTEAKTETSAGTSPNRIGSPVQKKLSLRALKTSPPCFCLLEEIRKNNLVMDEEIFSSGKTKSDELLGNFTPKARKFDVSVEDARKRVNVRQITREWELLNGSTNKPGNSGGTTAVKINNFHQINRSNTIEIYETTGGEEKEERNLKTNFETSEKGRQQSRRSPATPDVKELTAKVRFVKTKFEECWRPFKPPNWSLGGIQPTATLGVLSSNTNTDKAKQSSPDPTIQSNALDLTETSERLLNDQLNDYHQAKECTPIRRNEKYVKLPGLADAFDQHESSIKGLRLTNGTSFESVNALEELSMGNVANQMDSNRRKIRDDELVAQRKIETKDAATDVTTPLKSTKTQTGLDTTMVDSYVQCESHVVDEANGRNIIKNCHQEILVCDDNGDGVQLYNELGHPLTDMDGYLLKDSLGRFLVRLDDYGVPTSCTNGQAIFMEDSRDWDSVKNTMNIIHQCKKKPIKRRDTARKKASPSIRQLENAMDNLKNTLEWADKISLDSICESALHRFTDFDRIENSRPLKSMKPSTDLDRLWTSNNTSSLIAEMKSIARLRTALLEKVNFIVGNRKKLENPRTPKFQGLKKISRCLQDMNKPRLSNPFSSFQRQYRPHSPTYQAIETLKGIKVNSEVDSISSVDNLNETFLRKTSTDRKKFGDAFSVEQKPRGRQGSNDLWINSIADSGAPVKESAKKETDFSKISGTGSDDNFPISSKTYNLYEGKELSNMKLVSRDVERQGASSGILKGNSEESGLKEGPLLCILEQDYDLKIDDSWIQSWNDDKSPMNQALKLPFI